MIIKYRRITISTVVLMGFLLFQSIIAQNVLMTGWGSSSTDFSLDQMENHLTDLEYTVTRSNTFPGSLEGYNILILMGSGGSAEIPETVVDNFVNAGGGLIIFESIVQSGKFDNTANSNPVENSIGWDDRTDATVIDSGHDLCTGLSEMCNFAGYSTNPVMKTGAHVVIAWNDQTVFTAAYSYGSGLVVYINYLSAWYYTYWSGDEVNGKILMKNALTFVGPATDVNGSLDHSNVSQFTLCQNFPNPFNPTTNIDFELTKPGFIELSVYNHLGQKVAVLVHEKRAIGKHSFNFNAGHLASGLYFYRLKTENFTEIKKMVLIK